MGQPSTGNPSAYSISTGARFVNRVPVFFFAGAFVLCCLKKTDRDRRLLALVFLAGSLFSNALMSAAAYADLCETEA